MDLQTIASIVGLSSIISILVNLIFGHIEKKKMLRFEKIIQEKQKRYQATLGHMLVLLDVKNLQHISLADSTWSFVRDMRENEIRQYFKDEVEAHYSYSHLYADDAVLESIKVFIEKPDKENFQSVALAMRKDLWN